MRGANRNKQTLWYAPYAGKVPTHDDDGYENGWKANYGKPVKLRANISPAKGNAAEMLFGIDAMYDRIIGPLPTDTQINEYSVVWIGTEPQLAQDGSLELDEHGNPVTPWNHIVRRISTSLPVFGGMMIGADEVDVS